MKPSPWPLAWPPGQPRTHESRRKQSAFKVQFGQARDELLAELDRFGGRDVMMSTDVPLRRDGLPYADGDPVDPGCALYFERQGKPYVLACDTYHQLRSNVRALGATVKALRDIERHGSSELMERSLTGFLALPAARPADPPWWEVLAIHPDAPFTEIDRARTTLLLEHHPDHGGDQEKASQINRAYDKARAERGA